MKSCIPPTLPTTSPPPFCIEPRGVVNFFTMDIEQSATYEAFPAHVKPAWLRAVGALPPAWLNAPTQRSETYHRPLKKVTNGQLSLEDSASAISTKILSILKDLSMDEDRAFIDDR